MYHPGLLKKIVGNLEGVRSEHRYKTEVSHYTPQEPEVEVGGKKVLYPH